MKLSPRVQIVLAGLAALAVMIGLFMLKPLPLEQGERGLLDWRFRLRGPVEPKAPIVIAAVDQKSIDELGRFPWRRSVIAQLVDRLTEAGAAAIGFDIVFSEPEEPVELAPLRAARQAMGELDQSSEMALALVDRALEQADTDAQLETSIKNSEDVVLGFFFRTDEAEGEGVEPEALAEKLQLVRRGKLKIEARVSDKDNAGFLTCVDVEPNIERLARAARRAGYFSTKVDADGAVRRSPLLSRCQDALYVSLDMALIERYVGAKATAFGDPEFKEPGVVEIRVGDDLVIPTDRNAEILVNYRGGPETFPHIPASDIVFGRIPDSELEGRIVIVGITEVGVRDEYGSPFSNVFPGVEVHANVIDNILAGDVLRRNDSFLLGELMAVVGLGLLVLIVAPLLGSAVRGAIFTAFLLAGFVGVAIYLFDAHHMWINMMYPGLTIVSVYLAVGVTQSMTVEAKSRMVRRQFATYVPPEVVDEMTENLESFRLGGERREISILFSDIRSFTTISEEIGAENVVRMLDAYLTPMTEIIFNSRGTLDKYIGDAVVAFWGAPLDVPEHWLRCAESALQMQEDITRLRVERKDVPGMDRLKAGIGIHTGAVSVGNMGSELRFDYTMTGDGVNLCARIESLTKKYGADILASSELIERLPDGFLIRPLDRIRVKGRHEAVELVELLGRRAPSSEEKGWIEAYAAGRTAYEKGAWEEAERAFNECKSLRGGEDVACDLLLERLSRLKQEPPADWDGIYTFEEK